MNMQMIEENHQYSVWERVDTKRAKGMLNKMKDRLIRENKLSPDNELSFIAYAFKSENILVLAADMQNAPNPS